MGTKNRAIDLNNALFEQLERLNDASGDELKEEIARSKAMSGIAGQIIANANVALEAERLKMDYRTDGDMQPHFVGLLEG